jgi:4-amino-4-deoxy-L-arabinose transferase-like glycosyltransferase
MRSITLLLLIVFALLTIRLDTRWTGHHDENGLWISSAIRSYELYGAAEVNYLQVTNAGPAAPETYRYYVHHPPLIVWSGALLSQLTGYAGADRPHEAVVRLVAVYATMIHLAAFYVVVRRLYNPRWALWVTALYTLTPMILYFGRMPNHEPLALAFIMPFVAIYINWLRRPTTVRWVSMALLAALAMWTAWGAAFIFAGLGMAALWLGNGKQRRQIIALGGVTVAFTLAVPLFYEFQRSGSIQDLIDAFFFRTSNQEFSQGSDDFTAPQFVLVVFGHLLQRTGFAIPLLGFVGLWIVARREDNMRRGVIFGLVGGALAYILVFRNASFIHDYYKIYFMPGLTLAASVAIVAAFASRPRGYRRLYRPLVVSLVIVSLFSNAYFFVLLHRSGEGTLTMPLSTDIAALTTPDDRIASNLQRENTGVEYYAFRNIRWEVSPEAFLDTPALDVYVWCPLSTETPPRMTALPYEPVIGTCRLLERPVTATD